MGADATERIAMRKQIGSECGFMNPDRQVKTPSRRQRAGA
jgi:hypothetical protein